MIQQEIQQTENTIANAQQRVNAYKTEMSVLKGLIEFLERIPVIGGVIKNSTLGKDLADYNYNTQLLDNSEKTLSSLKAQANSETKWDKDYESFSHKFTDARNKAVAATKDESKAENENSKAKDGNTNATDKNTQAQKDNTASMDRAKEVAREYELQIEALGNAIKKQEDTTSNYAVGSEKRRESMKQEIELLKQTIGTYKDMETNASSVSNAGSLFAIQGGSALGKQIVTNAEKYLGTPYVWGGTSPGGFDCSGLVQYVYKQVGIALNRTSEEQFTQGTPVSKENLQPGDLVFFEGSSPGHVAIYAGDGKIIAAPHKGDVVKIQSLEDVSNWDGYTGARRIISGNSSSESFGSSMTYTDIVNAAARKYGLSASLIAGVIKEESDWDANSTSSAGAQGLMQLMPGTASEWGVKDAFNPYQNIMGGSAYLASLINKYGTNRGVALYNTGEYGGGSQSYANAVLNFASQYANNDLKMPTTSVSGTLSDEQDMASKVEDYEAKIEDATQKIHEMYKNIYEDNINQFENQTKAIDITLEKMQSIKDIEGQNDTAYITNLKQILDTTNSKISILKQEQDYVASQLSNPGGVYTDAVLQEIQEKNTELVNTFTNVQKAVKEAGEAWIQSKFDNITTQLTTNITLISNALSRLDNTKTVDLGSKLLLSSQKVDTEKEYIQQLTDLLRELNAEEQKDNIPYIFDKIRDINAELDKAKDTLSEDNKAVQDVKDSISDLTNTLMDSIKQVIQKNNEVYKNELESNKKIFENAIDKEVQKLEDAQKKLENNQTNYDNIQNVVNLQKELNELSLRDDEEGKSKKADIQKQLDEANRKLREDTQNQNIQTREDALNKAKTDYDNLVQQYSDDIDKSNTDEVVNKQASDALITGYLVDENGNKIDLISALNNYEDKFGEGLTVIGNKIKTELIDKLKEVQSLMNQFGTLDTTKINAIDNVKTVFATGVDLQNAEAILGANGYKYVDTNMTPANELAPKEGDIVLGNAINSKLTNGATNIAGAGRYQTEQMLQMYEDSMSGKISTVTEYNKDTLAEYLKQYGNKKGTVYGSGTDLKNAEKSLSNLGYRFIDTNDVSGIALTANDIVVGGAGVMKGISNALNAGAKWLWGSTSTDTQKAISNYANYLQNYPIDTVGYNEGGTDYQTGLTMLHGTQDRPETILNYEQGTNLHKFLTDIPSLARNITSQIYNSIPNAGLSGIRNSQSISNLGNNKYEINFNIDKINGTESEAKSFGNKVMNFIRKQG